MLRTPAEFPYPGSEAAFRAAHHAEPTRVRIVEHRDGDRAFVTGKGRFGAINMTVALDQLQPWVEPKAAIDLWADTRIASVRHPSFTRGGDVWADFKAWHERFYQSPTAMDFQNFKRTLGDRGYVARREGREFGFAFALHPVQAAA